MFIYLDTVNQWHPGTAGTLTYYQFIEFCEIAATDPVKYMMHEDQKDDTEAFSEALKALKLQGVANPSMAQVASVVARSKSWQ
jgi:hypothetical protein